MGDGVDNTSPNIEAGRAKVETSEDSSEPSKSAEAKSTEAKSAAAFEAAATESIDAASGEGSVGYRIAAMLAMFLLAIAALVIWYFGR
jgi:cobalamin biosynthesis Mg chelatase CobN